MTKSIFISFFLFFLSFNAFAAHIIGGSISYQYLTNGNYLIQMEVLRDCQGGGADYDQPASIAIYEGNALISEELVPYDTSSRIIISLDIPNNVCLYNGQLCVERVLYEREINFSQISSGSEFDIRYQRCCRANILANLIDPGAVGATFSTTINTAFQNSSPTFNLPTPSAVYANTAFVYDGSATDADGDFLVYSLTTPFEGGSVMNPIVAPASPKPDLPVRWLLPLYEELNMLGGDYPLTIDTATGEFNAIPQTLGVFQIAYKVEEYRNGVLVGSTMREFVFYVIEQPQTSFEISGNVRIDSVENLDIGQVQLLERDVMIDSFFLVDEVEVMPAGEYRFEDILPGVYYMRALPDSASLYYNSHLPTYYRSSLFWYDAFTLNQCDTSLFYRDINLIEVDSFAGGGGNTQMVLRIRDENGQAVEGLSILLMDEEENFVLHRQTNALGEIRTSQLPAGRYTLHVDELNSAIDNSNPPAIDFQPDLGFTFIKRPEVLELQRATSIPGVSFTGKPLSIYPNPSPGALTVEWNQQLGESVKLNIYSLEGQLLNTFEIAATAGVNQHGLTLPKGNYMLSLTNTEEVYWGKVWVK